MSASVPPTPSVSRRYGIGSILLWLALPFVWLPVGLIAEWSGGVALGEFGARPSSGNRLAASVTSPVGVVRSNLAEEGTMPIRTWFLTSVLPFVALIGVAMLATPSDEANRSARRWAGIGLIGATVTMPIGMVYGNWLALLVIPALLFLPWCLWSLLGDVIQRGISQRLRRRVIAMKTIRICLVSTVVAAIAVMVASALLVAIDGPGQCNCFLSRHGEFYTWIDYDPTPFTFSIELGTTPLARGLVAIETAGINLLVIVWLLSVLGCLALIPAMPSRASNLRAEARDESSSD